MDRLDAMRLFVRVVDNGSFAAVAREVGIGQPAVSKQIAALEQRLGAQLMRRTSRSMTLTEAGQTFYESAVRLVEEFDAAESLIGRGQSAPSGVVRVSVAPVFGRLCVVPKLSTFFARYPDISIELSASEHTVNLVEDGIDLAIRIGDVSDSSMTVRRIATAPFITVGTPVYFQTRGVPANPRELDRHSNIVFLHRGEPRPWGIQEKIRVDRALSQGQSPNGRCRANPRGGARPSGHFACTGLHVRPRNRLRGASGHPGRMGAGATGGKRRPPQRAPGADESESFHRFSGRDRPRP